MKKYDKEKEYDQRILQHSGEAGKILAKILPEFLALTNSKLMVSYEYEQYGEKKHYTGYKNIFLRSNEDK